jgi:hypothetical protein
MESPRAAFGVTPQGAMRVARQSRFHRILARALRFDWNSPARNGLNALVCRTEQPR